MAEDDDEGFGDFEFVPPQPQPHINGVGGGLTSSTFPQNDDASWGDFFIATSTLINPLQSTLSNGFSHPPPPQSQSQSTPDKFPNSKSSINFDPFGFFTPNLIQSNSTTTNPSPIRSDLKPKGALPLSLFGEEEAEKEEQEQQEEPNSLDKSLNGWFNPNPPVQNVEFGVPSVSNGDGFKKDDDVFAKLQFQNQQINPQNGSASDLKFEDEDDDWEFQGAFSANGVVEEGALKGGSASSHSKVEPKVVIHQEQQDASDSAQHKPGSGSSLFQFGDIFAPSNGAVHRSSELDAGSFKPTTAVNNDFMFGLFPGVEESGAGIEINATSVNEDDDFDFGDFVDASQEVGSKKQEGQVLSHTTHTEAQLPNGEIKDKQEQSESSRGALPLSLFSDGIEYIDELNHQDEMVHKPVSNPRNGFSTQNSGISIHDLLSNLYSQAQYTSSIDSNKKPTENGVHAPQERLDSTLMSDDDDWDENSWEFKDAVSETGTKEQSSSLSPGSLSWKLPETSSNLQLYMDFYAKLKDALCFLLSHQLDEIKKAQSSDAVVGNDGKADDIQEAYKLLGNSVISQEVVLKKHLERTSCLNEVLETLQGPNLKVIESEYSLSKRLQLATNDWRVTAELLRHSMSILHILSFGSPEEQSVYVFTWSKILNACAQELKFGALIWKKTLEKHMQRQVLSDHRGQKYIRALGEIYKVVELIRLSAKLYKPWMFLSMTNSPQFSDLLEECGALWSSSGLEEALQNIADNADYRHNQTAKALIGSINNIRHLDTLSLHDCVFIQQQSVCRLSLLPPEMLADLKTVLWNEEPYFLNLANLWANLISCRPPQLPHLQVR